MVTAGIGNRELLCPKNPTTESTKMKAFQDSRHDYVRKFVESIPEIVWMRWPDGTFEYLNDKWIEFAGLDSERSYGLSWLSLVHPEDVPLANAAWERAVRLNTDYAADLRLRGADRQYRWMATRGCPVIGSDGTVQGWVGSLCDINDKKQTEEILKQAERAVTEVLNFVETEI